MRINLGDDEQPEIGLIALIDCIFFLLMFFMLATSFKKSAEMEKPMQLPIVLPSASASFSETPTSAAAFVIAIGKSGEVYASGSKTNIQTLQSTLHSLAAREPSRRIRIDGDRQAAYQYIVQVLDLCQLEGLHNISMHTKN